ncbi:ABC transporter ATP-binding protein [Thermosulfuriphilus sp.]
MGKGILEFRRVSKSFGGLMALSELSFSVGAKEIVGLIGPNGAGKTTVINLASGLICPDSGDIIMEGKKVSGLPPWQIAALGLARSFQHLEILPGFTVLENVMVGLHLKEKSGFFSCLLGLPAVKKEEKISRERARRVLETLGLSDLSDYRAETLPYGLQRQIVLARAWASAPRILLLDEPAAGLNSSEREQLARNIIRIRNSGCSILLVEHDMALVMEVSERVLVLNHGRLIAEGLPRNIQRHPEVLKAYLG